MNQLGLPLRRFALLGITAAVLSACGGGGGSDSSTTPAPAPTPTPSAKTISGSAAAGAPIVGTVTIKDANGTTRDVTIGENGKFTVDVSDLTAPFVFRATGIAAGTQWTVYSGASAADVDGTINITPLTDLIIANVAGKLAADYFNSGNFTSLSKTQLDTESAKLAERLRPILDALGVNAAVDLLRTPFTPLQDQLDKVLDIIHVSYDSTDPAAIVATLTNIVTDEAITDSLATKAAEETNAPKMVTTSGVVDASGDIPAIRAALERYAALYATNVPTAEQIKAKLTANFLQDDLGPDAFANAEVNDDFDNTGLRFTDVEIEHIDYTDPNAVIARVSFSARDKNGQITSRQQGFRLRRTANGPWLLHGNRQCIEVSMHARMDRELSDSVLGGPAQMTSGIEFELFENTPGNCDTATPVAYAMIQGPGLPPGGIRYSANPYSSFKLDNGSTYYVMTDTREGAPDMSNMINTIPAKASYKVTLYDAADAVIKWPGGFDSYKLTLPLRPLNRTELGAAASAGKWPDIVSPSLGALFDYRGGPTALNFTNMNPETYGWFFLDYKTQEGPSGVYEGDVAPSAGGTVVRVQTLSTAPDGSFVTERNVRVATTREGWREFVTRLKLTTVRGN
ncbi:hypothetical protein [Niveibacterium sp. SC-1]|uniref:hypothetical protein n=1 Tax=Niveibacterium sp. SC-1 TaxID=3135646 RepID=UPI00312005CE